MRRPSGYTITVAWLLFAMILTGCIPVAHNAPPGTATKAPAPPHTAVVSAQLDQPFTLGIEQSAVLVAEDRPSAGTPVTITVVALAAESRCPVGPTVACESAGYASFQVRLTQPGASEIVILATAGGLPAEKATLGDYELELRTVAPARTAQHREISKDEYLVTLILRATSAPSSAICECLHAIEATAIVGESLHAQPIAIPDFGLRAGCAYAANLCIGRDFAMRLAPTF